MDVESIAEAAESRREVERSPYPLAANMRKRGMRSTNASGNAARIAALSADQTPTAIIGCPHMTIDARSAHVIDPYTAKRSDVGVVRPDGMAPYVRTYAAGDWNNNLVSLNLTAPALTANRFEKSAM